MHDLVHPSALVSQQHDLGPLRQTVRNDDIRVHRVNSVRSSAGICTPADGDPRLISPGHRQAIQAEHLGGLFEREIAWRDGEPQIRYSVEELRPRNT